MSLKRILAGLIALYNKIHLFQKSVESKLDATLSSRASEETLGKVAARLYDETEQKSVTQIAKEIRDKAEWSKLNNLDTPLSQVKTSVDALKGVDDRTLTDIYNKLGDISGSVTVTNFPSVYPLPDTQVQDLKNVTVTNFPSTYPLPDSQVVTLKNKVRIAAWDTAQQKYVFVEGYEGSKNMTYDENGNLTELRVTIVLDDGSEKTVKRTFTYDENGNLVSVSRWEVVS